jgi:hypothetical protein
MDSPKSDDSEFQMLEVWHTEQALSTSQGALGHSSRRSSHNCMWEPNDLTPLARKDSVTSDLTRPWWIAMPTSPVRLLWDFFGACLIFYDLFALPLEAFQPPEVGATAVIDWVILFYWTLNVAASVTVGYVHHGGVVLDFSKIVRRYLKSWFAIDLLVLVPDWVFTIESMRQKSSKGVSESATRLLRVLRLVRMVRLLRLLKLRRIFHTLNDMITSEYISVVLSVMAMILILLIINHQIGCCFYWVSVNQDAGTNWISEFPEDDWVYLYATSFHWSITQFTPATVDVSPKNLPERVFAIVVVIFALVGFSYMVGSITSSLAELRNMHAEESLLFWDLRRYLSKNKVRTTLSLRIQKYLEHAWRVEQDRRPAKCIQLMSLLSEQLHSELQYELAVGQLQVHPFLAQLCLRSSVTVQRLANAAISHKLFASGDFLFYPGETATHLWIVVQGSYVYTRVDSRGEVHRETVDQKEDWISEPVLWTSWTHRGLLAALEDGDDLAIDGKKFCEQVSLNPQAHVFAARYAKNFMAWLNQQDFDQLSDISQGEHVSQLCKSFFEEDSEEGVDNQSSQNELTELA